MIDISIIDNIMNKYVSQIIALIVMTSCNSKIISIETDSVYKTHNLGFSQANTIDGFLFTSGQVGWDTEYRDRKSVV